MDNLFSSVIAVRERIQRACDRAHRNPNDVTLVAVTKTVDIERIAEAYACGLRDFGENRPQELARKALLLPHDVRWHMIGHLQRNKIHFVVDTAACIHSVDSLRLLIALETAATAAQRTLPVYLEINVSREPQKHGWQEDEISAALACAASLPHIEVCGLMTVAQDTPDEIELRRQFSTLRTLRDCVGSPTWALSMGMSHDFEIAIEEGATVVRVGSAIFGKRPNAPHPA